MKNSALNWFEIAVALADFDRAKAFYEEALGESLNTVEGQRKMAIFPYVAEKGTGGALVGSDEAKPGPGGTMIYLNVEGDLDGVISRIPEAGGKIVQPRTAIPPNGFIAIFNDTEGNIIGLHSME